MQDTKAWEAALTSVVSSSVRCVHLVRPRRPKFLTCITCAGRIATLGDCSIVML